MRAALLATLVVAGCQTYDTVRDVPYGPDPAHRLDYHEPTTGSRWPLVLAIHGGAWQVGDKRDFGDDVAAALCPRGFAVASVNYRLAPAHRWPAQLDDVRLALAWLRTRAPASARFDRSRVAALGVSAGGQLASMLALTGDPARRVDRACSASGPGDLVELTDPALGAILGPPPWTSAQLESVSPAHHARPGAALIVVHAAGDPVVPFEHAARLEAAMRAVGAEVVLVRVPGDSHSRAWTRRVPAVASFLGAR